MVSTSEPGVGQRGLQRGLSRVALATALGTCPESVCFGALRGERLRKGEVLGRGRGQLCVSVEPAARRFLGLPRAHQPALARCLRLLQLARWQVRSRAKKGGVGREMRPSRRRGWGVIIVPAGSRSVACLRDACRVRGHISAGASTRGG